MSELALSAEKDISPAARRIGERALWYAGVFKQELGVNDPLTHLEQYLKHGEEAIGSIDEDLITDIAERKLKPTFINEIKFDRFGNDFVSRENKFSMRQMTAITEQKFAANVVNLDLYKRAKIESQEVERLSNWFESAGAGDVFVVESLGLTETEEYAIARVYEKSGQEELVEHVITLHNATANNFNQLHAQLGADVAESHSPLELLDNMYGHRPKGNNFVEDYVASYDKILSSQNNNQQYSFGLPKPENYSGQDDITAIRRQTALRSVYLDNLKILGKSQGYVTSEVLKMNRELGSGFNLAEGGVIGASVARELMDRSLQCVVATLNRAPQEVLDQLAASQSVYSAIESAGFYGGEARAEGIRYEGACPSGSAGAAAAEAAALARGNRADKDPSKCGTCPRCRKEYYVDDSIYKKKILECNNCHSAIRFDGSAVSKEELARLRGQESKGFLDLLVDSVREFNQKYDAEQQQKKAIQAARAKAEAARNAQLELQKAA